MPFALPTSRLDEAPRVLATVLATAGPAYSKQGTQVWVDAHGQLSDMLGGGCLDADIAEHAAAVLAEGRARVVNYDFRNDAASPWGLGTGCLGALSILLEPLPPNPSAAHVWSCRQAVQADGESRLAAAEIRSLTATGLASWQSVAVTYHGLDALTALAPSAIRAASERLSRTQAHHYARTDPDTAWFLSLISPAPRLVIIGAGRDVDPLYALARSLRWSVSVYDPRDRPDQALRFPEAQCGPALSHAELAALGRDTHAAIVMTHHLERDTAALAVLAASNIPFIGLLGPASRRDRILASLGSTAGLLSGRLFAPVGLDLGARTPAEIALSIGAQVLSHWHGADGGVLSQQQSLRLPHGS